VAGQFRQCRQWRLPGRIAAGTRGDLELCQQACSPPLSRVGPLRWLVRQCRSACRSACPWWAWAGRAREGLPPVGPPCRERAVAAPPRSTDEADYSQGPVVRCTTARILRSRPQDRWSACRLSVRQGAGSSPSIGTLRNGTVYEQFFTTVPPHAFTPADVLDLYLHRGSFETVLADEDQEQDADRWVSHTPGGQEFWQIIAQWIWNLRLEFGQQVSASSMRVTEFAYSQIDVPVKASEPMKADEPVKASEPTKADEPVCYGPPQWARRSFTKGFAGADFALLPDGTLRCPADHPLYPQERRGERDGSVRVLYAARIGHCRSCPLRAQCQENGAPMKPRRVSAVFWPLTSTTSPPDEPLSDQPAPSRPVLWGDWERCHLRRHWFHLLRTQTVLLTFGSVQHLAREDGPLPDVLTRAQRAHWRLSWEQRLARNARLPTTPPASGHHSWSPGQLCSSIWL